MAKDLKAISTADLKGKLKTFQALHYTVVAIWAVAVAVWIVLGHWRTDIPVFISTISTGLLVVATAMQVRAYRAELRRRETAG